MKKKKWTYTEIQIAYWISGCVGGKIKMKKKTYEKNMKKWKGLMFIYGRSKIEWKVSIQKIDRNNNLVDVRMSGNR